MTFFEDRAGADKVEELLAKAAEARRPLAMSVVNWGEVYYSVWRARGEKAGAVAPGFSPASCFQRPGIEPAAPSPSFPLKLSALTWNSPAWPP